MRAHMSREAVLKGLYVWSEFISPGDTQVCDWCRHKASAPVLCSSVVQYCCGCKLVHHAATCTCCKGVQLLHQDCNAPPIRHPPALQTCKDPPPCTGGNCTALHVCKVLQPPCIGENFTHPAQARSSWSAAPPWRAAQWTGQHQCRTWPTAPPRCCRWLHRCQSCSGWSCRKTPPACGRGWGRQGTLATVWSG